MSMLMQLPVEIRVQIYEHVFDTPTCYKDALTSEPGAEGELLNPCYRPSTHLQPLLVCRAWRNDATLIAFSKVLFVVQNPYKALDMCNYLQRLLSPAQVAAIRHLGVVADARHFRLLHRWQVKNDMGNSGDKYGSVADGMMHAFGVPELQPAHLTFILRRSSYWHYLFDYNVALVAMLCGLQGVERVTFVRNKAMIKGTMLTWFNRLVKLILVTDWDMRFVSGRAAATRWWTWRYDGEAQAVQLSRCAPMPSGLEPAAWRDLMAPLYKEMARSMEDEEWDPDPFSRVSA